MRLEDRKTSEAPEIEFTADVRARELRFEKVPNPEVRFSGDAEREADWLTERENLSEEVWEGVVYRNARVKLLIASETSDDAGSPRNPDKERMRSELEDRRQEITWQETERETENEKENE